MEDICRVCLSNSVTLMDMFAKRTSPFDSEPSLVQKIMECAQCDIQENDNLPQKICISCILNAESAFKFKRTCEQSQLILLSKVKEAETSILEKRIKLETPDEAEMIREKEPEIKPEITMEPERKPEMTLDPEIKPEHTLEQNASAEPEVTRVLEKEIHPVEVCSLENELSKKATSIPKNSQSKPKKNNLKKLGQTNQNQRKFKNKSHTQLEKHQCGQCLQMYSSASALRLHRLVHTGEKPHKCPHCEGRFARMGDLRVHIRIHTGAQPYECIYCAKKFSRSDVFRKHRLTHNEESLFKCPHCPGKFVKQGNFDRHLKTHNDSLKDGENMETLSEELKMPMKEEETVLDESIIKMLEVTMEKETIQDKLPTKSKTIRRSKKSIIKPSTKTIKKKISKVPKTRRQT